MTNKEILQADLLDILFEHRNKLYGAYALRKTYKNRLGLSLGVALSTVLLFVLMSFINKKDKGNNNLRQDEVVKLTQLVIPPDKPKEPEPPIEKPKPQAQSDFQKIIVVPDKEADPDIVENDDLKNTNIGNQNIDGDAVTDIVQLKTDSQGSGSKPVIEKEKEETPAPSYPPSFPGGTEAWLNFLRKYLMAPEDLEPGQRIEVQVRFFIDVDGSISNPEIVKSGGKSFDKEVLRVLKKMPHWEAAMQGGKPIAVPYTQPVIFIGEEQ
jgi:protein TonB